ncbi:MAG: dihydroorotase, partial [Chloroflexi bacterium]|nr:dihydroorotase [Chloroflexota bacterium]
MTDSPDLLIRGGRVIDPADGFDQVADLLVRAGRVEARGRDIAAPDGARQFDADGLVVAPGLVDPHCHLRTPGGEHKETI